MDPRQKPVTLDEVTAVRINLKLRSLGYVLAIEKEDVGLLVATHMGNDFDIMAALEAAGKDDAQTVDVIDAVTLLYTEVPNWPNMGTSALLGVIKQYNIDERMRVAFEG